MISTRNFGKQKSLGPLTQGRVTRTMFRVMLRCMSACLNNPRTRYPRARTANSGADHHEHNTPLLLQFILDYMGITVKDTRVERNGFVTDD